MQIFELHFNPKLKEGYIFDSFVYEPDNVFERKLGSLYLAGEIRNVLPQNLRFLDNLALKIKKNYYSVSTNSPERALSHCLKKTNESLAEEVKNNNISWLGNFNFAVLSLKGFELNFTKTGDLKILIIRAGRIIDIGKDLELREMDPYPLRVFVNLVSGKIEENDAILILTKDVFEFLYRQNILSEIAQAKEISSKKIKELMPADLFIKGAGAKVSGICFLIIAKPKTRKEEMLKALRILFQKEKKSSFLLKISDFYLKNLFSPALKLFKFIIKIKAWLLGILQKLKPRNISFKSPLPLIEKMCRKPKEKRGWILILILIFILAVGFLIFRVAEKKISNLQNKETGQKTELKNNGLEIAAEINAGTDETEIKKALYSLSEENLFFSPSNIVFILNGGAWQEKKITNPDPNFSFDLFSSYYSNLYFLDRKNCQIIKYPYFEPENWGLSQIWKGPGAECPKIKSMAIDGSVWLLSQDNSLSRYYFGSFQEKIVFNFLPLPENITKIKTGPKLPYFYLLEPSKKRVVITEKNGKIVKQFQNEKFDDLKDFSISENGKTIYLLNKSVIYKIEFSF